MPLIRDLRMIDEHFKSESVDVSTVSSSADKTVDITHKDDDSEGELSPTVEVKTVKLSIERIKYVKTPRETVKTTESHKPHKHYPRGNKRNWNNLMSHRLGSNFKMINKACYVCGSFEHLQNVCDKKDRICSTSSLNSISKINTVAASVNTAIRPVNAAGSQSNVNHSRPISKVIPRRHSQQTRPFNKRSLNKRSVFNKKVNTVRVNDSTARGRVVVSGNIRREVNAVKASACWVWKAKNSSASNTFKKYSYIDARGRSKSIMAWIPKRNKCYLIDFEAFDGGFVSFRDGKGRNSGKGKIKTGKLDFDDVYFYKEIKYNLFSVSQMCDKKNNVLFTDTECLVLSSNFKLLGESHVLLRVPRKDNIYSVDLKSVSPTRGIENQLDYKVKVIRSDNETEFKNSVMTQFCNDKGIKKEYSVARTLQQNRFAKRRNRTLIEAARTMLVDSKLPTTFWAEAVNTSFYVLNRALVTKPYNKTPYELIQGRPPLIDFMKPFGCPVTILNTRDNLGKFEGKSNEGYFVGNKKLVASQDEKKKNLNKKDARKKALKVDAGEASYNGGQDTQVSRSEDGSLFHQDRQTAHNNSTNDINTVSLPVSTARPSFVNAASQIPHNVARPSASTNTFKEHSFERFYPFKNAFPLLHVPMVTPINDTGIFGNAYDDDVLEKEVDMNNVDLSHAIPEATKFLNDHPQEQVIGSLEIRVQTRHLSKTHEEFGLLSSTLVDLPKDKWAIGTKWVYRNKKDEKGIVIKNKAKLVAQGHIQEEGIDYDEVFPPVARIEAIRLFLAYASFKDFTVYQIYVKSAFLYGKIEEDVYVCQPPSFEDPNKVYKVEKALYGLHQAPRAWPDITFAVCAYARFQVTLNTSHLHVVKRIFRYLKGQPKLGLWYPKYSPLYLEAYSDSDYARASLDRKSTTEGC
uniref:Ribonuclease H-like domain-containing protein n=1 Tax=Tanacetum cinerariifolium TaxID=118510 RepID=A0A699H4R2_TANCI|nr:ribonuclease H-like domain-containing protein [Tanacetum cinerariifolium]